MGLVSRSPGGSDFIANEAFCAALRLPAVKCIFQELLKGLTANLDSTELCEVVRNELRIQQGEATIFQPRYEIDESDFAGIPRY
jgi:hypothetical protein